MVNYMNSYIYKLISSVDDDIFIGSSCSSPRMRFFEHKTRGNRDLNKIKNPYKHFNSIGWSNVRLVLIEKYPCNSKLELKTRESHWISQLKPKLNIQTPVVELSKTPDKAPITK